MWRLKISYFSGRMRIASRAHRLALKHLSMLYTSTRLRCIGGSVRCMNAVKQL